MITNYQKHHSPALTTIPEDEELDCDLRIIRPLNDVKNDNINYYQIIRNHVKPDRPPEKKAAKTAPPKVLGRPQKALKQPVSTLPRSPPVIEMERQDKFQREEAPLP